MADIELVIKIPEKWFDDMVREEFEDVDELCAVIQHGIPLPKGHGDLIDRNLALSDNGLCEFHRYYDYTKMQKFKEGEK